MSLKAIIEGATNVATVAACVTIIWSVVWHTGPWSLLERSEAAKLRIAFRSIKS
jgi:hypothetical protein